MKIFQFLLTNWDSVLVVLAFLALIVVLIKRGETKVLNKVLFGLVTQEFPDPGRNNPPKGY